MFEKLLKEMELNEETSKLMTDLIVENLKLADKYGVDRDKHIRDVCATLVPICLMRSFKDFKIDEGEDEE